MTRAAAVFDLGQTLVKGDPMYDLALFMRERDLFDPRSWRALEDGMRGYREHLEPYEEAVRRIMEAIAAGLRGLPESRFREACLTFYNDQYRDAVFAYARPLVAEFRRRGWVTVGITGICETLAGVIASDLGLERIIATPFGTDATGRLDGTSRYRSAPGWKGQALDEAAARWELDLTRSWAFGDSEADAPMFERVASAVCLNARRELAEMARERGWTVLPAGADPLPRVRELLDARGPAGHPGG